MITSELAANLDKAIVTAVPDFIDVVTSRNPAVKRDAGIPATTRDIRTIRQFVDYANKLPTQLAQVEQLIGYKETHIVGLSPFEIKKLYTSIKNSVKDWPIIEKKMKEVATSLLVTSSNLQQYGQQIIAFVKKIDGYEDAQLTLGDITDKELASLPDLPLPTAGAAKIPVLLGLVDDIVDIIETQQKKATKMSELFTELKSELRELEYDTDIKLKLSSPTQPDGRLDDLAERIQTVNTLIEEETQTYKKYSTYTWVGAWWGPLGYGISYSIFGDDASKARDKLENLQKEKRELLDNQRFTNHVLKSMGLLQTDLQNLLLRLEDTTASTAHLESLWSIILEYIEQSKSQLRKSNSATELHSFVSRLTTMINNWVLIRPDAQKLLNALDDAINDR